jgi:Tfp pilus assembly PilM family ATPase
MNYLNDWVTWEAQQYLPAPLEEYFLDFQKLKIHEESGLWQILVVLGHREAVQERAHLVESFHLRPAIMDVDPLALQNAFEINYPSAVDFPVALVNVEQDQTTVLATRDRVPEGIATLATPHEREELCKEIQSTLDDLLQRMIRGKTAEERFSKVLFSGGGPYLQDVVDALSSESKLEVELADPFRELTILPALREKLDRSYRASEFMLATGLALRRT